jgi:hypothetical protein
MFYRVFYSLNDDCSERGISSGALTIFLIPKIKETALVDLSKE